jgi:hypothetical protein
VSSCVGLTEKGIEQMKKMASIEELNISGVNIKGEIVVGLSQSLKKIKKLSICSNKEFEHSHLDQLVLSQSLSFISLKDCSNISLARLFQFNYIPCSFISSEGKL